MRIKKSKRGLLINQLFYSNPRLYDSFTVLRANNMSILVVTHSTLITSDSMLILPYSFIN